MEDGGGGEAALAGVGRGFEVVFEDGEGIVGRGDGGEVVAEMGEVFEGWDGGLEAFAGRGKADWTRRFSRDTDFGGLFGNGGNGKHLEQYTVFVLFVRLMFGILPHRR